MTDTNWRLAGGIGSREPVAAGQQVMTQGLGFPLRQVDNTPPQDTGDTFNDIVAEGLFMQWMGNWTSGIYYGKGSFVRDGVWTMIANKLTIDPAAPVDVGAPSYANDWVTPGPPPTIASDTSIVVASQIYTFTSGGYIKALRVWVSELTANTNYRIIVADITDPENPITSVIEEPILTEDDWAIVALLDTVVGAGTVISVSLDSLNSGADTNISGGWRYAGPSQPPAAPAAQGWTQDNQRTSFRIDKFDLDGQDRGTELEGVIQDTTISVVQTDNVGRTVTYRVTTVTDSGTFMTYGVVLQDETGAGPEANAVTTIDIDVPIALPTEYVEEVAKWPTDNPSWGTITSKLTFNGVDQGVADSGFGVDIEFQEAVASPDWDIITSP